MVSKLELKDAMKNAMREKNKLALTTIRAALSAIQYQELQKGVEDLDDNGVLGILKSEAKKRNESIEFEEKAGRSDEVATLKEELKVLSTFLPKQLSEEELTGAIQKIVEENPGCHMGLIMKTLQETYSGNYDGKKASALAKELTA